MQSRCALIFLRRFLLILLGCAALPFFNAVAQSASFDVQISLSQKAAAKLVSLSEGIVVSATWSGDPRPGAERYADEIGRIDLGRETVEVSGKPQTVRISGTQLRRNRLAEIQGLILLNVNVYSGRRSGPDNILNCDFFDGNLQEAVRRPLALHCSLITEKLENRNVDSGGVASIPPDRAADSYAIYSLLLPGAPLDRIAPSQIQRWVISGTTVNISDMNPAIPPDGQLKAPPDNPKAFGEALADYQARKYQRFHLDAASFHMNRSYEMVDDQQVNDMRGAGSASTGIAFFSAVYFNDAQTAALVYVNTWCANLCSAGQWVYLEKHGGQWVRRSGIFAKGA